MLRTLEPPLLRANDTVNDRRRQRRCRNQWWGIGAAAEIDWGDRFNGEGAELLEWSPDPLRAARRALSRQLADSDEHFRKARNLPQRNLLSHRQLHRG